MMPAVMRNLDSSAFRSLNQILLWPYLDLDVVDKNC